MIQWVFVFTLLVVEAIALLLFILPLPKALKKAYMKAISAVWNQPQIRRVLIGCLIVVTVLFIDTIRTLYSITHKPDDVAVSQTMLISLFRQQRNAYLTGFTLFLLLVLYRIQALLGELFLLETTTTAIVSQGKNAGSAYDTVCKERDAHKKALDEAHAKIKQLTTLEKSMDALQKQADGQSKEYSRVLDENSALKKSNDKLLGEVTKKSSSAKKSD